MALNFDGLGIGVEFNDHGADAKVESLSSSVDGLWGSLKKVGGIAGKVGSKLSSGLGRAGALGRSSMGGVTGAIGGMVSAAMSPQLDTAYSSMYASFNKSFSSMTVGIQGTSKEFKKARKIIGGAAFGLNEDMDGAAKTWAAFRKQNIDLTKVLGASGLKGAMKDMIRITSVFGIEGEQLSVVISGLVNGFGFSEKGAGLLADKIFVVGKAFNAGQEAIQAWPAIFESLNNELADFGKHMSPEQISKLTLSVVKFGGALSQSLGIPAQSAMEMARTAFTTLAGERKNIINMFRGMGGEFGEVAKQLIETGGDSSKIFEMLSTGDPLKFMDTLREMAVVAESKGGKTGVAFQRLSGIMSQALGPDVTFAMKGNWDKVHDTLASIPDAIAGNKAKGALKAAAKAHHKTGLTAGEGWDRMIEGMKSKLFALSNKEIGGWKKNMKAGFADTFSVISKLAKADGPLGEMTTRMLAVSRVGLSALIPGLQSMAPLLGGIASSTLPVMTAMGSMGLSFKSMGKMALGGGALFAVFKLLKEGPDNAIQGVKNLGKNLWDSFGKQFPEMQKKVKSFWGEFLSGNILGKISDKITSWSSSVNFDGIGQSLKKVMGGIRSIFSKVDWAGIAKTVMGGIKTVFQAVDWAAVGQFIVKGLGMAFNAIGDILLTILGGRKNVESSSQEVGEAVAAGIGTGLVDVLSNMRGMIGTVLSNLFDVSGGMGGFVKKVIGGLAILLLASKAFRSKVLDVVGSIGKGVRGGFAEMRETSAKSFKIMKKGMIRTSEEMTMGVSGRFKAMGRGMVRSTAYTARKVGRGFKKMGRGIKAGLAMAGPMMAINGVLSGLDNLQKRNKSVAEIMANDSLSAFEKTTLANEKTFEAVTDTIDSLFLGIPGKIGEALGISRTDLNLFYHDMTGTFEKYITFITDSFGEGTGVMGASWTFLQEYFVQSFETTKKAFILIVEVIKGIFIQSFNFISTVIESVGVNAKSIFTSIWHSLEYAFTKIKMGLLEIGVYLIENTPDALKFDWMKKTGASWKKELDTYNEAGGDKGLKWRQANELKSVEETPSEKTARIARNKKKAAENAKADADIAKAGAAFGKQFINTYTSTVSKTVKKFHSKKTGPSLEEKFKAIDEETIARQETSLAAVARGEAKKKKEDKRSYSGGGGGKGGKGGKKKKVAPASAAARGDMAAPKDPTTRGLMENVSMLTGTVARFVKDPVQMQLKIEGDISKFLKFSKSKERQTTKSTLAR